MNFIKRNWKTLLIILLIIFGVSKCTSSGNYKRKLNKQITYTEHIIDSLKKCYSNSASYIDSLNHVIEIKNVEIISLSSQLGIYKDQNVQLNDRNKALANKQIIVNVENKNKETNDESKEIK